MALCGNCGHTKRNHATIVARCFVAGCHCPTWKSSSGRERAIATEDQEQITVADWLRLHPKLVWTATANGGIRHKATAGRLKAMGIVAGVPDILVFTPPTRPDVVSFHDGGLAIEMKRSDGGAGASKAQRGFMQNLEDCGWLCFVANGAGEAIEILTKYYGG